ncbi:MAG: hypothetical protein DMG68_03655 [Acidobacteria bacterium]|nr:MAG: hypothetical protein DMG68_03655 [Acidobacteriota bacterium]
MRKNLLVWLILLVVGFLLGFIPQYRHARQLQASLTSCQLKQQLSDIREEGALAYLEVTRKNYGTAGDHASRMFNQTSQLSTATNDANLKNTLARVESKRQAVSSALTNGEAAVANDLQAIVLELEQNAKL